MPKSILIAFSYIKKQESKSIREETEEKKSRLIKYDKPARGASGDIGFTQKASNTNGLRATRQQYLHKKLNNNLEF